MPDAPITVDPYDPATREQVAHFLGRELERYSDRVMVEGPRWRIEVAPGLIAVRSSDPARRERALERLDADRTARVAMRLALREVDDEDVMDQAGVSRVKVWSAKSRARMVQTMLSLDFAAAFGPAELLGGYRLGMLTLTYPGDWLAVAPDAEACRKHLAAFRRRYERRWGPLAAVWKREFQRRGAPHFHLGGMFPSDPEFVAWLSVTWAEVVGAERCTGSVCAGCEFHRHVQAGTGLDFDKGERSADPRRFAVYFSKHGIFAAKDYQNDPPAEWPADSGVGRFWGYWRVERLLGAVEVAPDVATAVVRAARRSAAAGKPMVRVHRWRKVTTVDRETGELGWKWRKRSTRVPLRRLTAGAGFLAVNDGPAFAEHLARVATAVGSVRRVRRSGAGPVGFLP